MSKKTNEKKKISVKLVSGQAVYVADVETLYHISNTYAHLASSEKDSKQKQFCVSIVKSINEAIQKTRFDSNSQQDDWY